LFEGPQNSFGDSFEEFIGRAKIAEIPVPAYRKGTACLPKR